MGEAESRTGTVISYREYQMDIFFLVFYLLPGKGIAYFLPYYGLIFPKTLWAKMNPLFLHVNYLRSFVSGMKSRVMQLWEFLKSMMRVL